MTEAVVQKQKVASDADEDGFLSILETDPELAKERYAKIFQKLVRYFAAQLCTDPENLASETIARTCRAVKDGIELTSHLETFLFGVAKNVALEDGRQRRQRMHTSIEELPPRQEPCVRAPDSTIELPEWKQELYHDCLHRCLTALDYEQRSQLIEFYQGDKEGAKKLNRRRLAGRLGINTRALSSRMLRLRNKLDGCIQACVARRRRSGFLD